MNVLLCDVLLQHGGNTAGGYGALLDLLNPKVQQKQPPPAPHTHCCCRHVPHMHTATLPHMHWHTRRSLLLVIATQAHMLHTPSSLRHGAWFPSTFGTGHSTTQDLRSMLTLPPSFSSSLLLMVASFSTNQFIIYVNGLAWHAGDLGGVNALDSGVMTYAGTNDGFTICGQSSSTYVLLTVSLTSPSLPPATTTTTCTLTLSRIAC